MLKYKTRFDENYWYWYRWKFSSSLSLSLSLFKVEGLGKFLLVLLFSALVAHT